MLTQKVLQPSPTAVLLEIFRQSTQQQYHSSMAKSVSTYRDHFYSFPKNQIHCNFDKYSISDVSWILGFWLWVIEITITVVSIV